MTEYFDEEIAEQNEYYKQYPPSPFAWLYIAVDIRDLGSSKIGLTTQKTPFRRFGSGRTYNPYLVSFTTYDLARCTWGTSSKELSDIEGYIHNRSYFGSPIRHLDSGVDSEWYRIHPQEAEMQVDFLLAKRGFSVDGKVLRCEAPGPNYLGEVNVERMKKIKSINRPLPWDFAHRAHEALMTEDEIRGYLQFLADFHSSHPYRVYL